MYDRSIGASLAPYPAGFLYQSHRYRNYPFYFAGGLKAAYDVVILLTFDHVKPTEEHARIKAKREAERAPLKMSV